MTKLVIVDQSLKNLQGHHYEYTVSVAEAAKKLGYDVLIASNKEFSRNLHPKGISVFPIFETDWSDARTNQGLLSWVLKFKNFKLNYYLVDNLKNILFNPFRKKIKFIYLYLLLCNPHLNNSLQEIRILIRMIRQAVNQDIDKFIKFVRLGIGILIVSLKFIPGVKTVKVLIQSGFSFLFLITFGLIKSKFINLLKGKYPTFIRGIKSTLKKSNITPEDHVFIHTLGTSQLEQILNFLINCDQNKTPHYHILLRRDFSEDSITSMRRLKDCLNCFYNSGLYPKLVTFYTDTEGLTKQHNKLSLISFITAPIPFRHENLYNQSESFELGRPIHIVYLGDARTEKGYQYLPDLVDALWTNYIQQNKVKFTIQSNYNIAGGEPGIREARLRLEQYPHSKVRLIKESMTPDHYYQILAEADILVIPYLPANYKVRSSGVLVEALSSGKPVVVPANTWMANQVDECRASIFDSPSEIPKAVTRILNDFQNFYTAAQNYKLTWRIKHSPSALVQCLTQNLQVDIVNKSPTIIYIIDADSIIQKVGAGQVVRNHLDYLGRCGYKIYGIFFFKDPRISNEEMTTRVSLAQNILEKFNLVDYWFLRCKFPFLSNFKTTFSYINSFSQQQDGLEKDLIVRGNLEIPNTLNQFLNYQEIDAVFLNYISSWSLVESLGLNQYPVICEMHDIQSYQYAFYGKRDIDELEFKLECELLDKCDMLLVNNYKEIEKIRDFVKKPYLQYTPYIGRLSPVKITDLDGCNTLIDILMLSGAERVNDTEQNLRLSQAKSLDLLFVSSHHAPNIYSLKWFFYEVYLPYLAERGVNLLIAGNIMNFNDLEEINHSQVFIAGVVENLRPLYAATRLVILPMKMGAGFNIKTIEALTIGKPVVATSVAMRGIEFNADEFLVFDDPKSYADQILRLLADPQARLQQVQIGFNTSQREHSQAKYDESLTYAFNHIIPNKCLFPQSKPNQIWQDSLIDWYPEIDIDILLEASKFNSDLFWEHPEIYELAKILAKFKLHPDFGTVDFCKKFYQSIMNVKVFNQINISQEKFFKETTSIEKRICIIVPQEIRFYYPTVKLVADELVKAGFYVDIFCIEFGKVSEIEREHKFNVINYKSFWNYRQNYEIGRLEFLANAITKLGCYDVYIGVNYLGVAVANFLSERFKKLCLAYLFELFEDQSKFGQYIEYVCANKIDAFIDVDANRLNYRRKILDLPQDSFYIHNVSDIKDVPYTKIEKSKLGGKKVLWYHGTISTDHGIEELLEGYCKCKSDIELHLTGPILEIPSRELLLNKINSASKPVFIYDPLPRKEVLKKALEMADVAICFYPFRNPNILDYWNRIYANPAKVFDYMALGIPTITSDNPSLIDYVQNEGWGLCVPPEDPDAVAEAIDFLVTQDEMRAQMSEQARKLFVTKYNLEEEVKPFINWLSNKLSSD